MHVVHERLVRRSPEQQLQLRRRPRPVERPEREFGRAGQAADVRQPALERMPQPDLARPEGRDDGEPARRRSCDHVHDRIQRRAIGPLQVVDHQHDGLLRDICRSSQASNPRTNSPFFALTSGKSSTASATRVQRRPDGQEWDRHRCQRRQVPDSTVDDPSRSAHARATRAVLPTPGSPAMTTVCAVARRRVAEDTADDGPADRLGPPRPARVRLRRPRHQSGTRPPEIRGIERELRRGTRFGAGRGIRPWTRPNPNDRRENGS